MYQRNTSHSDTELHLQSLSDHQKRRSLSTMSEPKIHHQESVISTRSRKSSSSKYDLPNYASYRTRSSLSLHILDVCNQDFENLCDNITPSFPYINNEMSEFINNWIDPIFRLYFLLFLANSGYQAIFVYFKQLNLVFGV